MNNKLENSRLVKARNIEKIVTIDLGRNMAYYYDPSLNDQSIKISHEQLLELPNDYNNTLFVSEIAHLDRPRNMDSLAQPFLESELNRFKQNCENNNNLLRLFPEMQSFHIRQDDEEKSDELDPIYLYRHITENPSIIDVLKKPSKTYEPTSVRKEGWTIKQNVNKGLNYARRINYGKHDFWQPRVWLQKHINEICEKLDDTTKRVFEISYYGRGNAKQNIKKGDVNINQINDAIYSVLLTLFEFSADDDINVQHSIRKRELTGELPGWNFTARYVIGFSPCHMRGGIARSNLKLHNFRTFLRKKAKENGMIMTKNQLSDKQKKDFNKQESNFFKKTQKEHKKAVKQMFLAIKKAMQNNPINEMQ